MSTGPRKDSPTLPRRGQAIPPVGEAGRKSIVDDLRSVVILTQLGFSLTLATLLALLPPLLLLFTPEQSPSSGQYLFATTVVAGLCVAGGSWLDTRRLIFLLQSLRENNDVVAAGDVRALSGQARRSSVNWLWPHLLSFLLFVGPTRPPLMDQTTGIALFALSCAITATVALALYATLRTSFLRVIELIPPAVMTEVVLEKEHSTESRDRISRRLVVAVVMPTLFVAVGCALIVSAHVRRAEEKHRADIAKVMARAVFWKSGGSTDDVGLSAAYAKATELGFPTHVIDRREKSLPRRLADGLTELAAPLPGRDGGTALVRFHGSTVGVFSDGSLVFAALAVFVAAALGLTLGNALTRDLFQATAEVRRLGTRGFLARDEEPGRPPRFRIVYDLQRAVAGVAERFRIFAQAQQDAIAARASATRMRGQFFASVSHDLRGPLNSILGFTELVKMENLSEGQAESLQVIADRGQELLTLIETILDAARIEVGQLSLMFDEEPFSELYADTLEKAAQLAGDRKLQIYEELEPGLPPMVMDRARGARAIATFIAYSVRATEGGKMWIRAERAGPDHIRIDVDVPARLHSADDLRQMLEPSGGLAKREHRGLALALQLANSVVRLHGGNVQVVNRRHKGSMFCITLPTARDRPSGPSIPSPLPSGLSGGAAVRSSKPPAPIEPPAPTLVSPEAPPGEAEPPEHDPDEAPDTER